MGSAWLGLIGAVIGGTVSLVVTLITSRLQWRQERERWNEQRERDLILWKQERESDAKKWENERQRDKETWMRSQADEQSRWLREQKLKCYLESSDSLRSASELAANISLNAAGGHKREEELAIVEELRHANRWLNSTRAVCRADLTRQVDDIQEELYYTMQALTHRGMGSVTSKGSDHFVEFAPGKDGILSETIDRWAKKLSDMSRQDLDAN
jgi:hypothetical protein